MVRVQEIIEGVIMSEVTEQSKGRRDKSRDVVSSFQSCIIKLEVVVGVLGSILPSVSVYGSYLVNNQHLEGPTRSQIRSWIQLDAEIRLLSLSRFQLDAETGLLLCMTSSALNQRSARA
ncbi:hypothetical protein F511_25355 [Dorcoceras hygrometricum]|uniref:Uncharacterized protein n=1 Tax=Dorcoceras hygrometricum TaxID=472368 RepID=A0A2Z7CY78_9LAMI|nr:hypothetical protein F511_25355 [Dorcoceras hygrometricum]